MDSLLTLHISCRSTSFSARRHLVDNAPFEMSSPVQMAALNCSRLEIASQLIASLTLFSVATREDSEFGLKMANQPSGLPGLELDSW